MDEVKLEYRDQKKSEQNITYTKEKEPKNKSSLVNPSQLQMQDYPSDEVFIKSIEEIKKECSKLNLVPSNL